MAEVLNGDVPNGDVLNGDVPTCRTWHHMCVCMTDKFSQQVHHAMPVVACVSI